MENKLRLFENKEFGKIRVELIDNKPYFNLSDVCKILGLSNPSQTKNRLNKDGVISNEVIDRLGRKQNMNFINESNLYKCIFQSKKKYALKFTDWVTEEVLPSIRKYREYKLKNEIENLKVRNSELQRQIKYVYTEDEIKKKNEINHLVRKNFNGNIIGAYINLYNLFRETYKINLKAECDKYNEDKEKRLKVNIIQYCLMTSHINQLYECCKMLYE